MGRETRVTLHVDWGRRRSEGQSLEHENGEGSETRVPGPNAATTDMGPRDKFCRGAICIKS